MFIVRSIPFITFAAILCLSCDVQETTQAPGTLPQVVLDTWVDSFQERAITTYDIAFDGADTTYTLYSGFKNEDGAALDFYVKTEGETDHDSYQMTISESGDVINIREETVLSEGEFPGNLLAIVREQYPDQQLLGMRRILANDMLSFAVNVLLRDTDVEFELEKFRFSPEGEVMKRSNVIQEKEVPVGG